MLHELKTLPGPFAAVAAGVKRAEFRANDRGFKVGDELALREWRGCCGYSGNELLVRVTHVQEGFGIPPGFAMLSVELVAPSVLRWPPGCRCEGVA